MTPTTEGRFRVLTAVADGLVLVDRAEYEPVTVAREGYDGDLAERVAALRPGYVVDAELAWTDGDARFDAVDVVERTLLSFVDGATGLFEAALDAMEEARRENLGVTSRVTYDADRRPVGALYAFADAGAGDVFDEFRRGTRPLEPLFDRAADGEDPPFEAFVFRPAGHDFVLVYVVFEKGSLLADTVRDTYDAPRPDESESDLESDSPDAPSSESPREFDAFDALE